MKLSLERPEVEEDLILSLIHKELHIHWLLCDLENVGFDTSFWLISLETIIFSLVDIPTSDDNFNWFFDTLKEHIEKLEENKDGYSTSEATMEIYHVLKERKHRLIDDPSS